MKLLMLSNSFPSPPNDGLRLVAFHLLRLLAKNHQIHLIAFHPVGELPADDDQAVLRSFGVSLSLVPVQRMTPAREVQAHLSALPHSVFHYRTRTAFDLLKEHAKTADVVHALSFNMGQFVDAVGEKPKVFSAYDAISLLMARQLKQPSLPLRYRVHFRLQISKIRRFEATVLPKWDLVHYCSPVDAEAVRQHVPDFNCRVIPYGMDLDGLAPPPSRPPSDTPSLVFTGAMAGGNNVDAVQFFHRQVLPRVRLRHPQARFVIVGRDPAPEVRALAVNDPLTIVTGTVPEVRDYLWRASAYICPLRVGVGIKTKVMEAMAAGCPIVTTTVGAEGIDVQHGEHLLVADEAEEMAQSVIRLLDDRGFAQRLGQAARQQAIARYSWETMASRMEALYTEAVQRRARPQKV